MKQTLSFSSRVLLLDEGDNVLVRTRLFLSCLPYMGGMRQPGIRVSILVLQLCVAMTAFAQKGGSPSAAQGNPQTNSGNTPGSGNNSQGLQGFSFAPDEWSSLTLPDVDNPVRTVKGRTVLCYKLTKANSATQPFVLQPIKLPDEVPGTGFDRPCGTNGTAETDREGRQLCIDHPKKDDRWRANHWNACSPLDESHPIIMGQELVIGVDTSDLHETGINLNQVKLLNINVTSQQSAPLNPSPIRPSFPGSAAGGATTSQGSAGEAEQSSARGGWWSRLHSRPAGWDGKSRWQADSVYQRGDVVADSSLTNFFRANAECFNSGPALIDPFPRQQIADWIQDGSVIWQEMYVDPDGPQPETDLWQPTHPYERNDIVSVIRGGAGLRRRTLLFDLAAQMVQTPFLSLTSQVIRPAAQLERSKKISTAEAARFEELNKVPASSCTEKHRPKAVGEHLEYYWAVKAGTSGTVPEDPFSIVIVPRAVYLAWPYQLPGDIIPNISVNVVYSPPMPGAPWQGNTFYPAGSVVTSSSNKGHYYAALTGGFSGSEPGEPTFLITVPSQVKDGDLVWLDSGTSAPSVSGASTTTSGQGAGPGGASSAGKPQLRLPNAHYLLGDVILDPANGHYYTMVESKGGRSGSSSNEPFTALQSTRTLRDGDLLWQLTNKSPKSVWKASTEYRLETVVSVDGTPYEAIATMATQASSGAADSLSPPGEWKRVSDGYVVWQDLGKDSNNTPIRSKNKLYSFGQQVSDGGEVYVMVATIAGSSGSTKPQIPNPGRPTTVSDGDLVWIATGLTCSTPNWTANFAYSLGQRVCSSSDHEEYQVIRFTAGTSAASEPTFTIATPSTVIEGEELLTAGSMWKDSGIIRPIGMAEGQGLSWNPKTTYKDGAVVHLADSSNGRYFTCSVALCNLPPPSRTGSPQLPLTWQDIGTVAPTVVAAGQPADQTVSILNAPLPQTHSLSYFNIAAGGVVSFVRPATFGFVSAANLPPNFKLSKGFGPAQGPAPQGASLGIDPATGCTVNTDGKTTNPDGTIPAYYCPIKTGSGSFQYDPVLALTVYYPPVDAEVPFRWNRPHNWIPGGSVAFSLANPTNNFYFGGSNEFLIRNIQIIYGLSLLKTSVELAPLTTQPLFGGTGAAPTVATKQGFQKGFFMGFTFNLSNFIQSLGLGASKTPSQ